MDRPVAAAGAGASVLCAHTITGVSSANNTNAVFLFKFNIFVLYFFVVIKWKVLNSFNFFFIDAIHPINH
jgi:hypothetical protein